MGNRAPGSRRSQEQIEPALSEKKDNNGGDFASAYRRATPILDGVYQMVAAVLVGTLGGWWLDRKLGTSPWLVIAGSVLGIGGGMTVFLRAALRIPVKKPRGPSSPGGAAGTDGTDDGKRQQP